MPKINPKEMRAFKVEMEASREQYKQAQKLAESRADEILRRCGLSKQDGKALIASLQPRDAFEHTTALQITSLQQMSLLMLNEASLPGIVEVRQRSATHAGRLISRQVQLMDALHRHREAAASEATLEAKVVHE